MTFIPTAFSNRIGSLLNITYSAQSGECILQGTNNNFGFHVYAFRHVTQGLERTALLFATPGGKVGELTIFPDGRVAVVIEHHAKAPMWAQEAQKRYCLI